MNDAPIGIFDSGVGGLTVARAVLDQLPHEPIWYVGDTARGPYGPRPLAQVREFALEILDTLVADGVKMVVIACNSASAAMLRDARERYDVPVIEVVHPAVRRAAAATRNRQVGVIGTAVTISSGAYVDAFAAAPQVQLTTAACPRFVEFVEAGVTWGPELIDVATEYLQPMKDAGVDTLVLGCTHYVFAQDVLRNLVGPGVQLVETGAPVARHTRRLLQRANGLAPGGGASALQLFSTGDPQALQAAAARWLRAPAGPAQAVDVPMP